ncbi:MAG: chemotaxis protein CheW [Gammaproteobacteria bacterium]|nr:chemotaxis protein CheW [Gammaproteobacteria bacterium]
MTMVLAHEDPFQWLQALEQRTKKQAKGLPRQEKIQETWRGIAFRLDKALLVTPLEEVREVGYCPKRFARVPGAKSWVKGIANIRGLLLPVIDLQACLSDKPIILNNRSQMLIINQAGISSGVLVDEVLGIKHFPVDSRNREATFQNQWFAPFARGTFTQEEKIWVVFDMHALSKSRVFLDAAV